MLISKTELLAFKRKYNELEPSQTNLTYVFKLKHQIKN
jgi:hypothetical protein